MSTDRPRHPPRPGPAPPPDPAGGWDTRVLDLDAYLARIGHHGPVGRDAGTLATLHRAHVTAIPFENLDVVLGRGISTDLAAVQDKLVHRRRGGYCYEMNLLFAAALEHLGIPVRRQLVRPGDPRINPRPRSHLLLVAEAEGERWLADVGFASGLLEPVPVRRRGELTQDGWTYRITTSGPGGGPHLAERREGRWEAMYTLIDEPTYPVDVVAANAYSSTSPDSPFTQRPIVIHRHPHEERRLIGRSYTVREPGGTTTTTVTDAGYARHLAERFGLVLSDAETTALLACLPEPGDLRA